jgi:filamentous hemagglutinin family protein
MSAAHALDVNALPTGGQVTAGSASINQTGNTLNINQSSQKAALNWQNFNIGSNSTVNFVQPNSNAVALNRIVGNSASEIYGHLNANGQVLFINPNGILFGRGSQVNVGGIVATTMQLGDADFLAGNYNFNNAGAGSVANYGLINATNSVALLGSDVSNQGSIFATTVSLVSGNTVALDVSTDGLIRARVVDVAMQANIANSGDIDLKCRPSQRYP